MDLQPQLYVYELKQDDPKKCTSAKLRRFNLVKKIKAATHIPPGAVVLNPKAQSILQKADRVCVSHSGLVAVDCSWKRTDSIFSRHIRGRNRRLPLLLAANPINYGHIATLTSLEALAAALYITGFRSECEKLLTIFNWAPGFLTLNSELLDCYSEAQGEEEILRLEYEYFRSPRGTQASR